MTETILKNIAHADWLQNPILQSLLAALNTHGEEARIVGGAVRNTLLDKPVSDIDIATTTLPNETIERLNAAGFKTVPTGIDHGTITAVKDGFVAEVTTLRADIETDGRHAKVIFGKDWQADATRRDFTINALYCTHNGQIIDLVGGLKDIPSKTIRFIGEASERIEEDYLRILRLFRFFAQYGSGRPDAEALKASARLKGGLETLSAERIQAEMLKLLSVKDPSRALLWMRQTGVLTAILPESEKWGIDTIPELIAAEQSLGWAPDALLRLIAITPMIEERRQQLSERWKLSSRAKTRLLGHAMITPLSEETSEVALKKRLYWEGTEAITDHIRISLAQARAKAEREDSALVQAGKFSALLKIIEAYEKPVFPLSGQDLIEADIPRGPEMGQRLKAAEAVFVETGFTLDKAALLEVAKIAKI